MKLHAPLKGLAGGSRGRFFTSLLGGFPAEATVQNGQNDPGVLSKSVRTAPEGSRKSPEGPRKDQEVLEKVLGGSLEGP